MIDSSCNGVLVSTRFAKNIQTAAFLASTVQSSGTAAPILLLTASDLQKI